MGITLPVLALTMAFAAGAETPDVGPLVAIYKDLHTHPELSHKEERTAALLAAELRKAGYTVTEHLGKYPDGTTGHGLVGILKNGTGPRLLIRADMDALPVTEETNAEYASQNKGVMHACGHDVHMATLIGTARALAARKGEWHGTLMLVGQPSEETIDGAKAMLADNLYERFGKPDMAIALHDTNAHAAGTVGMTSGPALAASISVDVLMRGVGGHGAAPNVTKDPVVMAAEFVTEVQTVVSRQESPTDPAVITVGTIRGGTKRNIIPDEVKLELTTRCFTEQAKRTILDGIRRTAQGVAVAAGVPEDRMPLVTVLDNESTPVLDNNPELTGRVRSALQQALGAEHVRNDAAIMGSEDFGIFGLEGKIPIAMFWLGAMEPGQFAETFKQKIPLPGPHTSRFQPAPEPTLRTGVKAMTAVAVALLQ